jgi:DNA-binding PadR family transcriptional regulator
MAENGHRRFFRSGELHLVLLALLGERPQHGYELMSELGARFGPAYRPSPGSIYPALTALEAEGLVAATDDGDRRVYRVTPAGLRAVEELRPLLGEIESRTGARFGGPSLEPALARFTARVRDAAPVVDPAAVEAVLEEAAVRIERLGEGEKAR